MLVTWGKGGGGAQGARENGVGRRECAQGASGNGVHAESSGHHRVRKLCEHLFPAHAVAGFPNIDTLVGETTAGAASEPLTNPLHSNWCPHLHLQMQLKNKQLTCLSLKAMVTFLLAARLLMTSPVSSWPLVT